MNRDEELDGHLRQVWGPVGHPLPNGNLGNLYAESGQTLQGSFSAGWLAGKPDYLQKLKVPEGYEKINDYSNI